MMFTVDGAFNSPSYGVNASASYDYFALSSTALCASAFPLAQHCRVLGDGPYLANERSRMLASRLLQLCDDFDREFFQKASCASSLFTRIWRLLF
ncbi:unnamed protein product [Heligmosomoides polygyrus]|uniref:DUF2235 domain-containing protein n=1 Tax=Heligmosomoides polygyrus TaxID=6339 RepID=A0A183G112_HELPZ|nr:unnamed protein product [Heligmosomoides polygyrus]